MIGLDTNILVRYLVQDDAIQSPRATQIIEHQLTEEQPGFISLVTMVETVWVLDRFYGLSNASCKRIRFSFRMSRKPSPQ
jgi:predicted nucleic-acid-binding protein